MQTTVGSRTFYARIVDATGTVILPAAQYSVVVTLPDGVSISNSTVPFDGNAHYINVENNSNGAYKVLYSTNSTTGFTETNPRSQTNVGSTTVYAKVVTAAGDVEVMAPISYKVTVTAPTGVTVENYTGFYDGQPHALNVSNVSAEYTVEYSPNTTAANFTTAPITQTEPGALNVYVRIKKGSTIIMPTTAYKITINKLPLKVKISDAELKYTYGNDVPEFLPSIQSSESELVAGDTVDGLKNQLHFVIDPEPNPKGNANARNRGVSFSLDSDAAKYYNIELYTYLGSKISGTKANIQIVPRDSIIAPVSKTIYYGEATPNLNEWMAKENMLLPANGDKGVLAKDVASIPYFYDFNKSYGNAVAGHHYYWNAAAQDWVMGPNPTLWSYTTTDAVMNAKLEAGTYLFQTYTNASSYGTDGDGLGGLSAINYFYSTNVFGTANLEIKRKPVTITAADAEKVLGTTDSELTATMTETAYGETIDYTVSRVPGETAGTYDININVDKQAYPNYKITTVPATFTIKEKAPIVVPTKQAVTITAHNAEKFVGEQDPAFTSTVTGIANSSAIEYTLSRVPGETVGTYAIQVNVNESAYPNYSITTVPATFTIKQQTPIIDPEKRAVTITANDAEKFVGEADPQLTAIMTKIVDGDSIAYTLSREPGETVGTYVIQVNVDRAAYPDYEITTQPGVFTIKAIAPKPVEKKNEVTITANDAQKFVGQADPELTATMTKIVDGDSISYTLSRVPGEIVGTYAINVNVDESAYPNYTITTVQGTFTILPVVDPVEPPVTPAGETPAAADTTAPPIVPGETTPTDPTDPGNPTSTINDGATPLGGSAEDPSVTKDFGTGDTPLAQGSTYWALLNLILAILTSVIMLVLLASFFAGKNRRKEEQSSDSETGKLRRKGLIRLLSIIPTVVAIVLFLLTENMSNPMILTDQWTVLMAVIAIAQIVVAFFATKSRKKDKHEGHMETPQTQNA